MNIMSVDVFLGLPFNLASYALLSHIFARILGLTPRRLIGDLTNVHIYNNHIEQVKEQLSRTEYALPTLVLPEFTQLIELLRMEAEDFSLENYKFHPPIKADMAV